VTVSAAIGSTSLIPELDVWHTANLLIRQHGPDAEPLAAKRADLMLERGDLEGQALWKRIRRTVAELQAPPTGPLH
jgi:hypothetical protein